MLAGALDAGCQSQQFLDAGVTNWQDVGHGGLATCDRAGLVQRHDLHALRVFQCLAVLEQNAHRRAAPCPNHDRGRRCQAERAWAGDYQHGDRVNHCCCEPGLPDYQPS